MANNIQTLNLEQINRAQTRPWEVNLGVIKNEISELLDRSQNISDIGMDSLLNEAGESLIYNLENLHVNYRLKENNPLLFIIYEKQSKYPRLHKFFSKKIKKLVNKFKNEHKKDHKSRGACEIGNFISENIPNGETPTDYRKIEALEYIYGVVSLTNGRLERSNTFFNKAIERRILANTKMKFSTGNLKKTLSDPNTTIRDLEETAQILLSVDYKDKKFIFSDEFLQGCKNNVERLKEELGNEETLEENKYNYYANICYLRSFISYDDAKRKGVDADNKYREADELLDKGNFYSFYSNKENLQKFIEDNCFKPDILHKKTQDLQLFYSTCLSEKKQEVFDSLSEIIEKLKEEFKNSNEKLAAVNFFEAECLVLSSNNKSNRYFECRKNAMDYYSKINSNEAKIVCLSVGRICYNDLDNNEKKILKESYNGLAKLTEIDELYKEAQYECGKYIKNEDKNKAFEYFKNSAGQGYNKAKIEVAEYYVEEYNQAKEENTKEDRKKDIETLVLSLPEEYNEKKAEIYEKIDSHKEAIECYDKLVKESNNRKNYVDNVFKLKKFFIKIGDCFTKLGDKIRGKNNNVNNEESSDCYKKAIKNYKNSETILKDENLSIESECKITLNYKKMNDFENYKSNLNRLENGCFNNLTEEKLKNISEPVKNLIADLCFDLSQNEDLIYSDINTVGKDGKEKKAKEYLKIAANLGHQKALVKYIGTLLINSNVDNENEILNMLKKLKTPEAKYEIARRLKLILKYEDLAFELFKEAADSGYEKAKYEVATMSYYGKGVKKDEKKAIKLFDELTKSDDKTIAADSLIMLGDIYSEQNSNKLSDIEKIVNFYREGISLKLTVDKYYEDEKLNKKLEFYTYKLKSVENNDLLAKFKIAEMYRDGIGVNENEEEAIKLFEYIVENIKDTVENTEYLKIKIKSLSELGIIYYKESIKNEKSKKENLDKAIKSYEKARDLVILNKGFEVFKEGILTNLNKIIKSKEWLEFKNAEKLIDSNKEKEALEIFKNLSKDSTISYIIVNSLINAGDIYAKRNNKEELQEAIKYYNKAIQLSGDENGIIVGKLDNIACKIESLDNTEVNTFNNIKRLVNTNKQKAINEFKEFIKNTKNQGIKIKSLIELGDIYVSFGNEENLNIGEKYYLRVNDIYLSSNNMTDREKNAEIVNNKLSRISEMKEQLKINKQKEDFDNAVKLIGTRKEEKAVEIFKNLISKDDMDQSIKIDSLIALGDIYAEKYDKENFAIARDYYQEVLKNHQENNDKFTEASNRFIILGNKESILDFDENTEKNKIAETVTNVMENLKKLKITIKEKKQKLKKFADVLKSKISGDKEILFLNKESKDKISFINNMLKANNEFFTNNISKY